MCRPSLLSPAACLKPCSVLGPILFLLYTADVTNIALRCGLNVHSYVDDTQLNVHCDAVNCAADAARLVACVEELDGWMGSNRLKLNAVMTQVMWVGCQQLKKTVGAEITLQGTASFSQPVSCASVFTLTPS